MLGADLTCTETELCLRRPLDELAPSVRRALTVWLWNHTIAASTLVPGEVIVRDPHATTLRWHQVDADGAETVEWLMRPRDPDAVWPAPFPPAVLEMGRRSADAGALRASR